MPTHRRIPVQVEAWQYKGQNRADWPAFVADYRVLTPYGTQVIASSLGVLLIPQGKPGGRTATVQENDWLVLEEGELIHYRPDRFDTLYESLTDTAEALASEAAPETEDGAA